jgi:hypothetical protein
MFPTLRQHSREFKTRFDGKFDANSPATGEKSRYDEAGHLLGEYSSTGALVEETVWLGDIPVATLRPSGSTVAVYYIEADHLNTPRQVTRPSDNKQMWTWFSDPFGTTAANDNPAGAGAFIYKLEQAIR